MRSRATTSGGNIGDQILADLDRLVDITTKKLVDVTTEAIKEAHVEFGGYQQKAIEALFKRSMKQFYDSYSPGSYTRRESLYNMLDIHFSPDGTVDVDNPFSLIDQSSAPTTRSGGSLFNQVFMEGWHGGASGISGGKSQVWWPHPSPGTPHYRSGGFTKKPRFYHKYGKWGRAAVRTKAPYDIFSEELNMIAGGEMLREYNKIVKQYLDAAVTKAITELSSQYGDIFS